MNVGPEFLILIQNYRKATNRELLAGLVLGLRILDTDMYLIQCLCDDVYSFVAPLKMASPFFHGWSRVRKGV